MLAIGYGFHVEALVLYPLSFVTLVVFTTAMTFWVSALNVRYRDVQHLIGLALLVWFWMTPIVYPGGLVQDKLVAPTAPWSPHLWTVYLLNPLMPIVSGFQRALYATVSPGRHPRAARREHRLARRCHRRRAGRVAPVAALHVAPVLPALRRLRGGTVTAALEVEDVSKVFRLFRERPSSLKQRVLSGRMRAEDFWALRDIAFEVQEGSSLGLIGHNGSGKTTLLKCIAGILRPTSGVIRYRGRVAALLELGAGFHPELTGRENVYLNASFLGLSRKDTDRVFDDIVAFAEFAGLHGQPGEVLLVGDARAAGLRGGRARRARHPADRRGARGRRRGVPGEMPRPRPELPGGGADDRPRDPRARYGPRGVRSRGHARPRPHPRDRAAGRRGARDAVRAAGRHGPGVRRGTGNARSGDRRRGDHPGVRCRRRSGAPRRPADHPDRRPDERARRRPRRGLRGPGRRHEPSR